MSARTPEDEDPLRASFQALQEDVLLEEVDHDRVWAAVTGQLAPAELRQVVEETSRHPSWALAWRLAHELAAGAVEETALRPVDPRPRAWPMRALALAAGLVLAAGLGTLLLRPSPPPAGYRDAPSGAIEARTPGNAIALRNGCRLQWQGPAGATYELRVTSEDLALVHTASGLTAAEYRVPPEFLSQLPPGSRVLWQVEARLADGHRLAGATFVATHEKECRS